MAPNTPTTLPNDWLAELRSAPGDQQLDPGEQIRLSWLPLDAAIARDEHAPLCRGPSRAILLA
jgi:hypothetical protein